MLLSSNRARAFLSTAIGGNSFVDQSSITGESLPVEKLAGNHDFAGTINQTGEVSATGIGRNTAFGKIIEAVEKAEKTRAPIQGTADRLAGYLVYFALGCAAVTYLVTRDCVQRFPSLLSPVRAASRQERLWRFSAASAGQLAWAQS